MAETVTVESGDFIISTNALSKEALEAEANQSSEPETPATEKPEQPAEPKAETVEPAKKPREDPRARVEQATAQAAQAKRERDEIRAERDRLKAELEAARRPAPQQQPQQQPRQEPPQADAEWKRYRAMPEAPKIGDFSDFEDYQAAMGLFIADKRFEERSRQQAMYEHQTRIAQAEDQHAQSFRQKLTDFDLSAIDPRLTQTERSSALPPNVRPTFGNFLVEQIYRSEAPKELLTHFTAHPEDVQRLATLHPTLVIREIGKLEARLAQPAAPMKTGTAAAPPISRAKPPITPVTGSSQSAPAEGDEDADSESVEKHISRWNALERKRKQAS